MGWTEARFGAADLAVASSPHDNAKPERVGKKYQRLAYHEALARLADRQEHPDPRGDRRTVVPYNGPWDHFYRDHDPSILLTHTTDGADEGPAFWPPAQNGLWGRHRPTELQLTDRDDLPDVAATLMARRPDGTDYLVLHSTQTWKDPSTGSGREVWAHVMSALVAEEDLAGATRWGAEWKGAGSNTVGWIPWPHGPECPVVLGEWHWSHADAGHRSRPDVITPRTEPDYDVGVNPSFAYEPTTEGYKSPYSYDGSLDEQGTSTRLPAPGIVDRLGPRWDGRAAWIDGRRRRAAFDPSPYVGLRPHANSPLFLSRDAANTLRQDHGLILMWSVAGEKRDPSGDRGKPQSAPEGYFRFFGTLHDTGHDIAGGQAALTIASSGPREATISSQQGA